MQIDFKRLSEILDELNAGEIVYKTRYGIGDKNYKLTVKFEITEDRSTDEEY